jgi:hypothetical protein
MVRIFSGSARIWQFDWTVGVASGIVTVEDDARVLLLLRSVGEDLFLFLYWPIAILLEYLRKRKLVRQ